MQTFLVRKRGPHVKPFYNFPLHFYFYFFKCPLNGGWGKRKLSNMTSEYTTKKLEQVVFTNNNETKFAEKCKRVSSPKGYTSLFLKKYFKNIRQIPFSDNQTSFTTIYSKD